MKKVNIPKICNGISILFLICFFVKTIFDYRQYSNMLNSAPFSVCVAMNALYFIVPAGIVLIVSAVIKKKKDMGRPEEKYNRAL